MRPILAACTRDFVAIGRRHSAQWVCFDEMGLPQPEQRCWGGGAGSIGKWGRWPLASRLYPCVKRVAGGRTDFLVADQNSCASHSAKGATARPQAGLVSASRMANGAIK